MAKKKTQWLLPTNTENLKMIIAQGLISSSDGFSKYYSDVLELVPNYIPLFKNQVPSKALDYVTKEESDLTPVILNIDINKISNGMKKLQDNKLIDVEDDINEENVLFILAPLPLSVISTTIFPTKVAINEFKKDSKNLYNNVILNDLKLSATVAEQKLFKSNDSSSGSDMFGSGDSTNGWINGLTSIETNNLSKVDYKKVYAYGGLLMNLFYFAKNGNLSNDYYKAFSGFIEDKDKSDLDIYEYFETTNHDNTNVKKKMNYGLIDIAIKSNNFKDDVLSFLELESWEERVKERTKELAKKLIDFESSNSNKTSSEKFREAKTPLEKTLLMLFLREDTEALMGYTLEVFSEQDYVNFAMMFGIRDKFIKAPKELKEYTGLQSYVSLKMAEYAHFTIKCNMKFTPTLKPLTVVELFNRNNLKKRLIKELKVESCTQTIMPNKEYSSKSGINTYVGFIEPKYEILEEEYFNILSKRTITKEDYNKFAKMK